MTATYDADLQLFINGAWRSGEGREGRPVYNPATAGTIAELPVATIADLDEALAAAERGWPVWRAKSFDERAALMHKAAGIIRERVEHIATLLTLEQGKPIAEARGEVLSAAGLFDYFAEQGKRIEGRVLQRPAGQRTMVLRPVSGSISTSQTSPARMWSWPSTTTGPRGVSGVSPGCKGSAPGEPVTITSPGCSV